MTTSLQGWGSAVGISTIAVNPDNKGEETHAYPTTYTPELFICGSQRSKVTRPGSYTSPVAQLGTEPKCPASHVRALFTRLYCLHESILLTLINLSGQQLAPAERETHTHTQSKARKIGDVGGQDTQSVIKQDEVVVIHRKLC